MLMTSPHDAQPQDTTGDSDSREPIGRGDLARKSLHTRMDVALDWAGKAAASCITRLQHSSQFVFALLMTALFYFPSLRNGSRDAGFLYGGDVLGFYWPYIAKLQSLLSRHQFIALDYSQFNASADFFLAANFFPCHPLFVAWSLCTSPNTTTFDDAGRILVWALALHSFVACYFSFRLLTRFFQLDFWVAAFASSAFAFSVYAINAHGEPMFVFCASVLPWAAYTALDYTEQRSLSRLILAAFPVLLGYLSGYIPLAAACLGIAAILVAVKVFLLDDSETSLSAKFSRYFTGLLPFVFGTVVAAPYLIAVYFFLKQSPSAVRASLFFSAHQLSEIPQSILRAFSFRVSIPGPFYEFSINWGLISIAVAALFLLSSRTLAAPSRREWTILKVAGLIYFAIALSIFGQHSVVSDLVFYYVPQIGGMHIYQRFLLPGQMLFGIMIALMLKAVIEARPVLGIRVAFSLLTAAAFAVAFYVLHHAASAQAVGLNNYLVLELLLAALCMVALLVPDKAFAYATALALFTLPALDVMYDRSQGGSTFDEQAKRHGVMLDAGLRQSVVKYVDRFRSKHKTLIKYVDITPRWSTAGIESFPKTFPDFVLKDVTLCPYTGFNFYLSTSAQYLATIPFAGDGRFQPDWNRIKESGADFVIALESDLPILEPFTGKLSASDTHRLPGGVLLAPLWPSAMKTSSVFDNGYLRISRPGNTSEVASSATNLAIRRPTRQSSEGGGEASRAVDGNTSGRFADGSVTHTANEAGAWLEVDLGTSQPIGSVRVWNRTELSHRLSPFHLIISDEPSASPAAAMDKTSHSPSVWQTQVSLPAMPAYTITTPGVTGRYVRVQLAEARERTEDYLSLAEVEVFPPTTVADNNQSDSSPFTVVSFSSNDANNIRLELDAKETVDVTHLLWDNPRLHYTLNGRDAPVTRRDGRATITVPPGRVTLDITYRHTTLAIFWGVYACYIVALTWAILASLINSLRRRSVPTVDTLHYWV